MIARWRRLPFMAAALIAFAGACSGATVARAPLPGFTETAYRVERGSKSVKTGCAFLATTDEQQRRGLMNVRDLKGHDGMIFQFPSETTVGFYMKDTPMALSIAWFDGRGQFVSGADMAPDSEEPSYYAAAPYRYAFEVPKGQLAPAGIGAGSTLVIGGAC